MDINGYPQFGGFGPNVIDPPKIIYQSGDAEIATRTQLGVIKVGQDLDITTDGTLSAAVHIENLLQDAVIFMNCGTSTTGV